MDGEPIMSKVTQPSAAMIEVLVDGARYGDLEDVQSALQHSVNVDSADSFGRTGSVCTDLMSRTSRSRG